jgi:uncharacterized protein YcfJ
VREALIRRLSNSSSSAASRTDRDEDRITASQHRECSFTKAISSKPLRSGSNKSSKQLQELALPQQQQQQQDSIGAAVIGSVVAGSSGSGSSTGTLSGPPSPTVAILMK